MKKKLSALVACLTLVVLASSSAMGGILLTPADAWKFGPEFTPLTIKPAIDAHVPGLSSTEIYKANEGGNNEGAAKELYDTEYSNGAMDALITWNGGLEFISATHLLVKGGRDLGWLLFEIHDWDGKCDITLKDFSPSISHVSIYGQLSAVPEPTSIGLFVLGMGCVTGGSFIRRRRA